MFTVSTLVAVQGIGKRFAGRQVVADISMTVRAGEVVGLVGANGGGKTTTLRILAGLLAADSGHGAVLGFDLPRSARRVRERVGFMPQGNSLYPSLSARENLRFRAAAFAVPRPGVVVDELLQAYGLLPFAALRADRLSGGWARLLQLAAAVIHSPQLILLDEPTAGLDVANRHLVWERIMALARGGVGVVLSTHDLAEAERCAQLTLLSAGVALATGSPGSVIAGAEAAVLAVTGEHALAVAGTLSVQPGVLSCYAQGNALRLVIDAGAQRRIRAQLEGLQHRCTDLTPSLEDATLALLRRRPGVSA